MATPKKPTTKKRSSFVEKDILTPPAGFDNSKYAGRWVSDSRLSMRSDGYEPRGYSVWKDANGNAVRAGTLTWCFKPKEEALADKQALFEAALDQRRQIAADDQALTERLDWELRQVGGGIKGSIETE